MLSMLKRLVDRICNAPPGEREFRKLVHRHGMRYESYGLRTAKSLKGFTLVEMLIVLVIVGILVAVALPNYLQLAQRARVAEAISLASGAQALVTDAYNSNGGLGTGPNAGFDAAVANYNAANLTPAANLSKLVATVGINNSTTPPVGLVTVTFSQNMGSDSSDTIEFEPEALSSTGDREPLSAATLASAPIDWACLSTTQTYAAAMGFHAVSTTATLPAAHAPTSCQ